MIARSAAVLALLLCGCASGPTETERALDKLQSEVNELRARAATLSARVEALEGGRGASASRPASAQMPAKSTGEKPAQPAKPDRPELQVVRLSPDTPPEEAPAVKIRSTSAGGVEGEVAADDPAAVKDYQLAKDLFAKRSIDPALAAFSAFIVKFPDHPKVVEATHHRGLCYLAKGDAKRAAEQFEAVVATGGNTEVTADGLFELAKARERLQNPGAAKRARERIMAEFPTSAAAKRLTR